MELEVKIAGVQMEPTILSKQKNIERWSPNQLRKRAATEIRSKLDVEYAASILGHSSSIVTADHYAAHDRQRAVEAARKLG